MSNKELLSSCCQLSCRPVSYLWSCLCRWYQTTSAFDPRMTCFSFTLLIEGFKELWMLNSILKVTLCTCVCVFFNVIYHISRTLEFVKRWCITVFSGLRWYSVDQWLKIFKGWSCKLLWHPHTSKHHLMPSSYLVLNNIDIVTINKFDSNKICKMWSEAIEKLTILTIVLLFCFWSFQGYN